MGVYGDRTEMGPGDARAAAAYVACVLLLCTAGARAYYLPGTVPVSYAVGDELQGNVSRGGLPSQPDGGDGGGGGKGGGRQGD